MSEWPHNLLLHDFALALAVMLSIFALRMASQSSPFLIQSCLVGIFITARTMSFSTTSTPAFSSASGNLAGEAHATHTRGILFKEGFYI